MSAPEPVCVDVEVVDGGAAVAWVSITGDVPELFVVDAVARLQLAAGRLGWSVRLRNPHDDLHAALDLAGLADVIETS